MTSAPTITRCTCCGREAQKLDCRKFCAPCRLYQLSASEGARSALVEAIRTMIESAITYEGVHPQDIREAVNEVLESAERNWRAAGVEFDERVTELTTAVQAQKALMPAGPVGV